MAGTEAAFGNELVERRDIFLAPALALERARPGKEAGEIDGDGASARLQLEWPREPSRKLVIGAAGGGEIHLEVARAVERNMEPKRTEAGLGGYVRHVPRQLRLVDGLGKIDVDSTRDRAAAEFNLAHIARNETFTGADVKSAAPELEPGGGDLGSRDTQIRVEMVERGLVRTRRRGAVRSVSRADIGIECEPVESERAIDTRTYPGGNGERAHGRISVQREGAIIEGERRSVPTRRARCREGLQASPLGKRDPGPTEKGARVGHAGRHVAVELKFIG